MKQAEATVGKHSYVARFDHKGPTVGFWNKRKQVFVAWKSEFETRVKTCFSVRDGLTYMERQENFELIWTPD